ncbi:BA14K family protein [Mesorhizobium sp. AR10]|uniref:BA14K family protein n=1 Tax=Mesorhizobium sp. AR10 TaxID=2865839 RepID=UPI00215ECA5E|nr:BA14K family protein [Mesorhizobium sp. AR10]UVK36340.1 BA14K family protein [Mesorhizobium sp. AR10]
MKPLFLSSVRSGLMTLGLMAGLTAPSLAAPIIQPDLSIPANAAAPQIMPVRDSWAGGNDRQIYEDWRWRNGGVRQWRGVNDDWRWRNRGARQWRGVNDDWRWRRHHRRHFNNSGIYLGLGLGLPAYQYYNNYDYAPRRYYRAQRLSSAHVQWCYDRYRSYRAWDNSFQPYNGPRQQCWSPYS